jgi:hypothetical protein
MMEGNMFQAGPWMNAGLCSYRQISTVFISCLFFISVLPRWIITLLSHLPLCTYKLELYDKRLVRAVNVVGPGINLGSTGSCAGNQFEPSF